MHRPLALVAVAATALAAAPAAPAHTVSITVLGGGAPVAGPVRATALRVVPPGTTVSVASASVAGGRVELPGPSLGGAGSALALREADGRPLARVLAAPALPSSVTVITVPATTVDDRRISDLAASSAPAPDGFSAITLTADPRASGRIRVTVRGRIAPSLTGFLGPVGFRYRVDVRVRPKLDVLAAGRVVRTSRVGTGSLRAVTPLGSVPLPVALAAPIERRVLAGLRRGFDRAIVGAGQDALDRLGITEPATVTARRITVRGNGVTVAAAVAFAG